MVIKKAATRLSVLCKAEEERVFLYDKVVLARTVIIVQNS